MSVPGRNGQNDKNGLELAWQISLPVLRKLSAELDASNGALARQDLQSFEKHVAAQEEICNLLLEAGVLSTSSVPVRQALQRLDHQKRVYSALLRRARTWVQVLLTIHQSRAGYSEDGSLLSGSTWSSEA
ncbi:MAG: hypothetical protein HY010_10765 [Acidobacteria bacterium]|nr:hypothetical protein [Acidobacteriota bacterium]